jgi:UDP-glucose 4-epimerase
MPHTRLPRRTDEHGRPWVLATGGAGFIGSHVCAELMEAGYSVVILDSFVNSNPGVVERINGLGHGRVDVVQGDVRDVRLLDYVLRAYEITAVVHLAGLKAVGESVAAPLRYYDANVSGALALFDAMQRHGVRRLVFSSSATVYAVPGANIAETAPLGALNPYGRTKLFIERIIDDMAAADPRFAAISLRYFNPVGAHASGKLGEEPRGAPTNLFPWITQVAAGQRPSLRVFGDDYETPDGSGVRDYIHVVDLAAGHRAAIDLLMRDHSMGGANTAINLGTGRGYSVFEAARAFSEASGVEIAVEVAPRRPGDAAECTADPAKALALLGWKARFGIERMCADHWRFQCGLASPETLEAA